MAKAATNRKAKKPAPAKAKAAPAKAKAAPEKAAAKSKAPSLKKAAPPNKAAKAPAKKAAAKTSTAKKAAQPAKPAQAAKPAKAAKVAPAKRAAPPVKKAAQKPAGKKAAAPRQDVDIKSASLGLSKRSSRKSDKPAKSGGGGLSFLSGKPGSSGEVDSAAASGPRLAKTKLTAKELRGFRELLLDKRRRLLGDVDSLENEALRVEQGNLSHLPMHMADQGTDNYEQEFTLSLADRDRRLITEVDHALSKIDDKTYGICEGTGQMISTARLEAEPTARYSIEYAKTFKRSGILRP